MLTWCWQGVGRVFQHHSFPVQVDKSSEQASHRSQLSVLHRGFRWHRISLHRTVNDHSYVPECLILRPITVPVRPRSRRIEQGELAKWLVENSCTDRVFFCNSGGEANEAALKVRLKYARKKRPWLPARTCVFWVSAAAACLSVSIAKETLQSAPGTRTRTNGCFLPPRFGPEAQQQPLRCLAV